MSTDNYSEETNIAPNSGVVNGEGDLCCDKAETVHLLYAFSGPEDRPDGFRQALAQVGLEMEVILAKFLDPVTSQEVRWCVRLAGALDKALRDAVQ